MGSQESGRLARKSSGVPPDDHRIVPKPNERSIGCVLRSPRLSDASAALAFKR